MDSLQQLGERIIIVGSDRRRRLRKRTAKRGGDPGLVSQIIHADESAFRRMIARGVPVRFN